MLLSDNGGSQEGGSNGSIYDTAYFNGIEENVDEMFDHIDEIGGPSTSPNYPKGWAQVCNTPFKYYKQDTFFGGTRVPLIIHCPPSILDPGSIRSQFYHVIDITPSILDLLNIDAPSSYEGYTDADAWCEYVGKHLQNRLLHQSERRSILKCSDTGPFGRMGGWLLPIMKQASLL